MIGLLVIGLSTLLRFGVEADISLIFEDVDLKYVDPQYFDPDVTDIHVEENDEGEFVLVSKVKIENQMPADATAHVAVFGLSMGSYKIPTGLDLEMPICDMTEEPVVVGPLVAAFGFTKENCPPVMGTYAQDGYKPPLDLMPDSFPENKYKGSLQMMVGGKIVFDATVEMDIKMA